MPFNRQEAYIAEAVRSLQNQSWGNFQAILVDNMATDDSLRVARETAGDDPRFVFEREEKPGIDQALNRGLARATGEWVTFLDADDYFLPERLDKTMKAMAAPETDMVVCRGRFVDENGRALEESDRLIFDQESFPLMLLQRNICWSMSLITVRREKLVSLGLFPQKYNALLDMYLLLWACGQHWQIAFVDEVLTGKRCHESNYSANLLRQMTQELSLTTEFVRQYPPVSRFYTRTTLCRLMTQKYLRGVQYARRQGRYADILHFAENYVADGWLIPSFYDYFHTIARWQVDGLSALLAQIRRIERTHPLDFFLHGQVAFAQGRYPEAEAIFAVAGRALHGHFPEADLGRALSAAMTDRARGKRLLRKVLNQKPDYRDAWLSWQQLDRSVPVQPPTLFPMESTLNFLLQCGRSR